MWVARVETESVRDLVKETRMGRCWEFKTQFEFMNFEQQEEDCENNQAKSLNEQRLTILSC